MSHLFHNHCIHYLNSLDITRLSSVERIHWLEISMKNQLRIYGIIGSEGYKLLRREKIIDHLQLIQNNN